MIKSILSNEILSRIVSIERLCERFVGIRIPVALTNRLRKNSMKKKSSASTRIEGNPLSEEQASEAIESSKRHFLKPEQEVRNYFDALQELEVARQKKEPFSKELVLRIQARVVRGESREKIGFRGAMPPGVLFAVYDMATGAPDYIPPEASEIPSLVDELVAYVRDSDDHPLIKAAIVHYQLVTIHPFEDGNGRTARLMSDYLLSLSGYGFNGIGSLEEYFAYDIDEYYRSLQMGLPALYYDGRENPPHPEIWIGYFLRMVELHAKKVLEIASQSTKRQEAESLSHLTDKERAFLAYLRRSGRAEFSPISCAAHFHVSNRTIINWCAGLCRNGFLVPSGEGRRIRAYHLTPMAK